jgi:GNAT superfamily N-acetyltransferase
MAIIRRAGVEDMDILVDLRMALMREAYQDMTVEEAEFRELTRRYIEDKFPKGELLVWLAEEEGLAVGIAGIIVTHQPPTFRYPDGIRISLHDMYTLPEYRRRGIAIALGREVIAYVKTTPAKRIGLHATEAGRPLYELLGFVARNDEMVLVL